MHTAINWLKKHTRLLVILAMAGIIATISMVALCWRLITPNGQFVYEPSNVSRIKVQNFRVGLVLGAGVDKNNKPYRELQGRLDQAAQALRSGEVDKLILSGDNRFKNYDEPTAMRDYLVGTKHVDASQLQRDFAGRSTYESCERAKKVFGQNKLLIISARSHLPRAIYLCRHFGIEAYGLPTDVEANNSLRRELLARVKAVLNVYVIGERTVLGETIRL